MVTPATLRANPTREEAELLALYETVKGYEKEAEKLKRNAAMAKQREADEKFKREQQALKKTKKSAKKRKAHSEEFPSAGGADLGDFDSDDDDDSALDEDQEDIAATTDADEHAMEEERQKQQLEEALGDKAQENIAFMPSLKRKAVSEVDEEVSLIQSAPGGEALPTPPRDFSESYGLEEAAGSYLFPPPTFVEDEKSRIWTPPSTANHPSEGDLELELTGFNSSLARSGSGNNTLMIKFSAPSDSSRFSLNIAGPGHRDYFDVLFHFNPRQFQKGGQLIVNDKQEGIWGMGVTAPLSALPIIFGQISCTLIVQINADGFDVFVNGIHCSRLEHRTQLPPDPCSFFLQFPSTDDYGSPENWSVFKVWWGHKPLMAGNDLSGVAGCNNNVTGGGLHPKKLFVSGLSKITEEGVDLRRAELERAFRKYGGPQGATVTVPVNSTYAFVEVESERQADLALAELQSQYRMNRARRSRYDATQEEREAAEAAAAKAGSKEEASSEWD